MRGKKEKLTLEGKEFAINKTNLIRFRKWWKLVNWEHGVVFWATGLATILMLSMLSWVTVYESGIDLQGLDFLFKEAKVVGLRTVPIMGGVFLLVAGLMLFSTQLAVFDATSRIMAENLVIFDKKRFQINNLDKFYYGFLWTQIGLAIGLVISGFKEPLFLVTLGAALNAAAMLVYCLGLVWMNTTSLEKELRPSWRRIGIMFLIIYFLGVFCWLTLKETWF